MDNEDLRLFSTKELYRMAHDAKGNSTLFKSHRYNSISLDEYILIKLVNITFVATDFPEPV